MHKKCLQRIDSQGATHTALRLRHHHRGTVADVAETKSGACRALALCCRPGRFCKSCLASALRALEAPWTFLVCPAHLYFRDAAPHGNHAIRYELRRQASAGARFRLPKPASVPAPLALNASGQCHIRRGTFSKIFRYFFIFRKLKRAVFFPFPILF